MGEEKAPTPYPDGLTRPTPPPAPPPKRADHIAGEWVSIRSGGFLVAQGHKCSCGVVGCQTSREVAPFGPEGRGVNLGPLSSAGVRHMEWQPIETAPKDGTRFIAWGPNLAVAECEWREAWAHYDAGWYRSNQHPVVEPTHWQPLPSPPVNAKEEFCPICLGPLNGAYGACDECRECFRPAQGAEETQ